MADPVPEKEERNEPVRLDRYAEDNLLFIRRAMERSGSFTGISGKACIAMGLMAIAGSYIASLRYSYDWWIWTWTFVATGACLTGIAGMVLKARRLDIPLWAGAGKRFLLSFAPPITAGIVFSEILYRLDLDAVMPGVWLMLYGVAILTGGAFSVRVIPLFGTFFMFTGAFILLIPLRYDFILFASMTINDFILATFFGLMHILFGIIVIRYHGG